MTIRPFCAIRQAALATGTREEGRRSDPACCAGVGDVARLSTMAHDDGVHTLQRKTAAAGAALLVLAFGTGILLGLAMTNKVSADVHEIVAAHLNAVLGCLWLIALAYTLPMLRFGQVGMKRLVSTTVVAAYMNWLITTVKAFLHVTGVDVTGDHTNDVVFAMLGVFVVVPSLVAAIGWTYGLCGPRRT